MNDEELRQPDPLFGGQPSDETAPVPEPARKWEMPKPVFKKTSGYLPQGYERHAAAVADGSAGNAAEPPAPAAPASVPPVPADIEIEPQPVLSEEFSLSDVAPAEQAKQSRGGGGTLFAAAAVIVFIGLFVAVFLALVYFLFLKPADAGTF